MIRAASLQTMEIDDVTLACHELKEQMNQKLTLLKNSVGLIQCAPEFIEAGIVEPLYRELGVPLAGGTTVATATDNNATGSLSFSMLVLTSDEVEFTTAHTTGLAADYRASIARALGTARNRSAQQLALALAFLPVFTNLSGDYYLDAIEAVCGKIPVFGTNLVDDNFPDFSQCLAICNDQVLSGEMSCALLFGAVNPRFFIAAVPPKSNLEGSDALITRADDNVVYEINQMTALKHFESLGLAAKGELKSGDDLLLPLLITPDNAVNERPFVRGLLSICADGSALCSGLMPVGAQITFGSNNGNDVVSSTTAVITQAMQEKEINAALIFSCITRQLVIGIDSAKELKQIKQVFSPGVPFLAAYSGGEFAPTSVSGENLAQNRYHNYSLILCLL